MRRVRHRVWFLGLAMLGAGVWWMVGWGSGAGEGGRTQERNGKPLGHEVYVWQRAWGPDVQAAVREHGGDFARVVVLGAQISWEKDGAGRVVGKVFRVKTPWAELRGRPVGAALRIGGYAAGAPYEGPASDLVENTVRTLCVEARGAGVTLAEVQLDFDAAESKLDGYRQWVKAAKRGGGEVPVRITALPAWLNRAAFRELAREAGGYVLQVHSLERPKRIEESVVLCDAAAARAAVEKAGEIGVPFRVALPTYGYVLVFDRAGQYAGLEAEGEPKPRPEGAQLRWLGADAGALAGLVQGWQRDRPAAIEGIIWYRLPVQTDRHNWRWATLAAVMTGRAPQVRAEVTCVGSPDTPGLRDVAVTNSGEDDLRGTMRIRVTWKDATLLASDVIGGFEQSGQGERFLRFHGFSDPDERLAPGETRKIAWIRLDRDTEVQGHVEESNR